MEEIKTILFTTCLEISQYIRNGNSHNHGKISGKNISNDDVKELDNFANNIIKQNISKCKYVRYIASEEDTNIIDTGYNNAPYLVSYDQLDGSGNVDVNITVGTIFAVFKLNKDGKIVDGRQVKMAGYCIYSQSTQFVIAEDDKPLYIYFPNNDRHIINIPSRGNIYSINESNKYRWMDNMRYRRLINNLIKEGYTSRWVGCLVADTHRILLKGGFFAYPRDEKNKNGKLRLLYEGYPMAFIMESAGGYSSDGRLSSLLDVEFDMKNIHQKTGLVLSSGDEYVKFRKI